MSSTKTRTYRTFSSEETRELGVDVARELQRERRGRGPAVFALKGDLGAGKTTFVQGFMKGLGSRARVASPTFILMRRHALAAGKGKKFTDAFHIDAYRLKGPKHFSALDLEVILANPRNIILIEWPEQAKKFLPRDAVWIRFKYGKKENERIISIK